MLVVWESKETDPPLPPTERRARLLQIRRLWEDIGKACRWKHPRAPSVERLWKEKATEAVLRFLKDARMGCIAPEGSLRRRGVKGMDRIARGGG